MDISLGMSSAWLLPVLCVAAFVIVTFWGRQLPGKGAFIAIGTIGLGFVIFWFVLRDLLFAGPKDFSTLWFYVGDYDLRIGMIVDELSVMMLGVVTFVALLVQDHVLGASGPAERPVQRVVAAGREDRVLDVHRAAEELDAVVLVELDLDVVDRRASPDGLERDAVQLVVRAELDAGELDAHVTQDAAVVLR